MIFLIGFDYQHFCQGYERAHTQVIVRDAVNFNDACQQIENSSEFEDPEYFRDLTI